MACQIVGWTQARDWFRDEQTGYLQNAQVPAHRIILGMLVWRPAGSLESRVSGALMRHEFGETEDLDAAVETTTFEVRINLDTLRYFAEQGYEDATDETREVWSPRWRKSLPFRRHRVFQPSAFAQVLAAIEQHAFNFASESYAYLAYSSALTEVWVAYRSRVDNWLHAVGKTEHLDAIQTGLASDNAEMWRQAMYASRDLITDVANYLWKDPRDVYDYLDSSDDKTRKLQVTQGKVKNRLLAYLHQKLPWKATKTKHLKNEAQRLADSLRTLYDVQSTAHAPVEKAQALSVAINTYVLLGELIVSTDMQPIERYVQPTYEPDGTDDVKGKT